MYLHKKTTVKISVWPNIGKRKTTANLSRNCTRYVRYICWYTVINFSKKKKPVDIHIRYEWHSGCGAIWFRGLTWRIYNMCITIAFLIWSIMVIESEAGYPLYKYILCDCKCVKSIFWFWFIAINVGTYICELR